MGFINLTNHPSDKWNEDQKRAAQCYGAIEDLPFPEVDPEGGEDYVRALSDRLVEQVIERRPDAVLCQGEFTLAYSVIRKLQQRGVTVLAACSKRNVMEKENRKVTIFEFVRFREYEK